MWVSACRGALFATRRLLLLLTTTATAVGGEGRLSRVSEPAATDHPARAIISVLPPSPANRKLFGTRRGRGFFLSPTNSFPPGEKQ